MKCEFEDCEVKSDATEVLRLTSFHGQYQNPMRLGNRRPARIAVCKKCSEYLCNDSKLKWKSEGRFIGVLNIENIDTSDIK